MKKKFQRENKLKKREGNMHLTNEITRKSTLTTKTTTITK